MNSIPPAIRKLVVDGFKDKISVKVENHYTDALINSLNQGKCTYLQGRFNHAKGNIIITMDGDSPHKAKEMRG
ncbi:MAG: hypothetical protein WED07_05965 [Candidatus Freyarchaeum deiterrae]